MPYILTAFVLFIAQVLLTATAYFALRFEILRRQDRELRTMRRRISRINDFTNKIASQVLDDVYAFKSSMSNKFEDLQKGTDVDIAAIRETAEESLRMSKDMSRRFDRGEKPPPNVNLLSIEERQKAREDKFARTLAEKNAKDQNATGAAGQ